MSVSIVLSSDMNYTLWSIVKRISSLSRLLSNNLVYKEPLSVYLNAIQNYRVFYFFFQSELCTFSNSIISFLFQWKSVNLKRSMDWNVLAIRGNSFRNSWLILVKFESVSSLKFVQKV